MSDTAPGPVRQLARRRWVRLLAATACGLVGSFAVFAAYVSYVLADIGDPIYTPGRLALYGTAGLLGVAVPALASRALMGRWDAAGLLLAAGPPAVMGLLCLAGLA